MKQQNRYARPRAFTARILAGILALLVLAATPPAAAAEETRLNINQATAEALEALPGVGPSRAAQIVELRQSLGGFSTYEQLLEVNGIGPRTLEKMRDYMTLDGGVPELSGEPQEAPAAGETGGAQPGDQQSS